MATTREDIKQWLEEGKRQGATHLIVACDTFDWSDYPVYVTPGQQVSAEVEKYQGKNMQKVMEVYDLSLPFDAQLDEQVAWHVDGIPAPKRETVDEILKRINGPDWNNPWLGHYILEEDGSVVRTDNFALWGKCFEDIDKRRIGETLYQIGDEEMRVSTVFLGLPHHGSLGDEDESPCFFETMVFADDALLTQLTEMADTPMNSIMGWFLGCTEIQIRYRTKDEAVKGHQQICEFVEACLPRLVLPMKETNEEASPLVVNNVEGESDVL